MDLLLHNEPLALLLVSDARVQIDVTHNTIFVVDSLGEAHSRLAFAKAGVQWLALHGLFVAILSVSCRLVADRVARLALPLAVFSQFNDVHSVAKVDEDAVADKGIRLTCRL